uniref:Uncharacterized protein n=1 Tax=Denticeps clupeoides TaxID=299321 RepID=A0AAY4B9G4_9TELE
SYRDPLFFFFFFNASDGCPGVCMCPAARPSCPPGVSAVPDGCGCCRVCAAQLNQDCDAMRPCDHHKGLECNYGNDVGSTHGICRAKLEGRSCEYNGRMFQNGENFQAGCKHHCTCIDGAVGCVPLCPSPLIQASPSCPAPRLVSVPGRCCPSLDCNKGSSAVPPVFRNALVDHEKTWDKPARFKHRPGETAPRSRCSQETCAAQTTAWSPCSRSCGMGVSSRVTNDNVQCKLVKESRLCNVRPCGSPSTPAGRKCSRTQKAPEPLRLRYAGCRSGRLYRPNYCGVCVDGRCCSPRRTRTAPVRFSCPDGGRFHKAVMFIQSCKCGGGCGHLNEAAMSPQHWLYGDTHKFSD